MSNWNVAPRDRVHKKIQYGHWCVAVFCLKIVSSFTTSVSGVYTPVIPLLQKKLTQWQSSACIQPWNVLQGREIHMLSEHPVKAKPQSFTTIKRQTGRERCASTIHLPSLLSLITSLLFPPSFPVSSRSTPAEEKQSQEAPKGPEVCIYCLARGGGEVRRWAVFLFATAKAQWSEHLPGSGTAGPPAAAPWPPLPARGILRPLRASSPSPPSPTAAPAQRRGAAARQARRGVRLPHTWHGGSAERQLSARGGGTSRPRREEGGRGAEGGRPGRTPAPLRRERRAEPDRGRSLPLLCGGAAPCACGGAASRTQAAQGWPRNASGLGTGRSRAAMAPRLLLPPCCFSRFLRRRRRRASERDTGFENAARHPRDVPPPTRG